MTDKWNDAGDPNLDNAGTYSDPPSGDSPPPSMANVYREGIEFLKGHSYKLVPDVSEPNTFHRIYHIEAPEKLKGLDLDDSFALWHEVLEESGELQFQEILRDWIYQDVDARKFWIPFIEPDPSQRKPMYGHARNLARKRSALEAKPKSAPAELGIEVYPLDGPGASEVIWKNHPIDHKPQATPKDDWRRIPRAFIPQADRHSEITRSVTIKDIASIWPDAELEMLALTVGRALAGPSNTITPTGNLIMHTSRTCALVLGEDPGLGKTSFFTALWAALSWAGYTVGTFNNMNSRFNMAPVVTKDIIYKDDICSDGLKKFVTSDNTKTIITSLGLLRVEEKGIAAVDIKPTGAIFINANELNPRLIYDIDPGAADRIKVLTTLRQSDMDQLKEKHGRSMEPEENIPYLAKKCNIEERTLMLWFARMCVDKFLELIKPVPDKKPLRDKVHALSHCFQHPLYKNTSAIILSFLLFCDLIGSTEADRKALKRDVLTGIIPTAASLDWGLMLKETVKMVSTPKGLLILACLKHDFEETEHPSEYHPWIGAKLISVPHLNLALLEVEQTDQNSDRSIVAFTHLRLFNGMPLSKDPAWIYKSIRAMYSTRPKLADLYAKIDHGITECETYGRDIYERNWEATRQDLMPRVNNCYRADIQLIKQIMSLDKTI